MPQIKYKGDLNATFSKGLDFAKAKLFA